MCISSLSWAEKFLRECLSFLMFSTSSLIVSASRERIAVMSSDFSVTPMLNNAGVKPLLIIMRMAVDAALYTRSV